jgi:hypothetical protein
VKKIQNIYSQQSAESKSFATVTPLVAPMQFQAMLPLFDENTSKGPKN